MIYDIHTNNIILCSALIFASPLAHWTTQTAINRSISGSLCSFLHSSEIGMYTYIAMSQLGKLIDKLPLMIKPSKLKIGHDL